MRNHYEVKDSATGRVLVAVAGAVEHGSMWHDYETANGRDMNISKDSALPQWLKGALMTDQYRVEAAPLYYQFGGREYQDNEARIMESTPQGPVSHGKTSDMEWTALQPADFGAIWYELADTLVKAGCQAERSVLMRLQAATGSQLVGCVKLGNLDFGAGDSGQYYLAIATSYDQSRPSQIYLSMVRSVCANQDSAAVAMATSRGRIKPIKLESRNRGGIKLQTLIEESATDAALVFTSWAAEYGERMKKLKAIRLDWNSQSYFQTLLSVGLESKALTRGKAEDSIPLDDSMVAALRGVSESGLDKTNLGMKLLGTIAYEAGREESIGIADCVGTAFGVHAGITNLATRRGEEGRGPLTQMAALWTARMETTNV